MAVPSRSNAAWERVLAAIEAEAARAAALLAANDSASRASGGYSENNGYDGYDARGGRGWYDGRGTSGEAAEWGDAPRNSARETRSGDGAVVGLAPGAVPAQGIPSTWRLPSNSEKSGRDGGFGGVVGVGGSTGAGGGASGAPVSRDANGAPGFRSAAGDSGALNGGANAGAAGAGPGLAPIQAFAAAVDLVLPDEMPPIPPELVGRIEALRTQITSLQADLQTAIAEAQASLRLLRPQHRAGTPPRPELVDRRL